MILKTFGLNTTYQSKVGVQKRISAFAQEIEEPEETITRGIKVYRKRLALGKTYAQILESGGHLGC
jgi:hypothetical protein